MLHNYGHKNTESEYVIPLYFFMATVAICERAPMLRSTYWPYCLTLQGQGVIYLKTVCTKQ